MGRPGLLLAALSVSTAWPGPARAQVPGSPDSAQIVTADIARFWQAFDQRDALGAEEAFDRLYLGLGSPGLLDFVPNHIRSAEALAETVAEYEPFYRSIRARTLGVLDLVGDIHADLATLERLYPESVFPPVYFVIGRLNSGGDATEAGLIIGIELFATSTDTPFDVLEPGMRSVLESLSVADLPHVVVHELVHFQQGEPEMADRTLLGQALYEGVADFVSDLATGGLAETNERTRRWGDEHEREVWREFRRVMTGRDFSRWLYNQGRATPDWPSDVGYYVGFKIAEAYYERAEDPHQALSEMLHIEDPRDFLARSGYGEDLQR
ncbi:MAG: DUF2268 domain-containing putative Zn-dependent protease [Gemmatimonadota bacterium]